MSKHTRDFNHGLTIALLAALALIIAAAKVAPILFN